MNISFKKANVEHISVIFDWFSKSHMTEFWDNSLEHKDDIMNFISAKSGSDNYKGMYG